jgi:hypothetical protein
MALWQYSMHLVPRAELVRFVPSLSGVLPEPLFDETDWWANTQPPEDLAEQLTAVLPEIQSWDSTSRVWGHEDLDTVAIGYKSGEAGVGVVDEFWARLDLREPRPDVLDAFVAICRACDGWWIAGAANRRVLVDPNRDSVLMAIRGSTAARFVVDPQGVLRSLADHRRSD